MKPVAAASVLEITSCKVASNSFHSYFILYDCISLRSQEAIIKDSVNE